MVDAGPQEHDAKSASADGEGPLPAPLAPGAEAASSERKPVADVADGVARHPHPDHMRLQRWTGQLSGLLLSGMLLIPLSVLLLLSRPGLGPDIPSWLGSVGGLLWLALVVGQAIYHHRWPALAHQHTTYALDARGLEIRRGVLWRNEIDVPASRIQHTDVKQGPLERRLGLATLVVHTAGTRFAAVALPGLEQSRARSMRDHVAMMMVDDDAV